MIQYSLTEGQASAKRYIQMVKASTNNITKGHHMYNESVVVVVDTRWQWRRRFEILLCVSKIISVPHMTDHLTFYSFPTVFVKYRMSTWNRMDTTWASAFTTCLIESTPRIVSYYGLILLKV